MVVTFDIERIESKMIIYNSETGKPLILSDHYAAWLSLEDKDIALPAVWKFLEKDYQRYLNISRELNKICLSCGVSKPKERI